MHAWWCGEILIIVIPKDKNFISNMEFLEKMLMLDIGYFQGLLTNCHQQLSLGRSLLLVFSLACIISYALMTLTRKSRILKKHFPSVWKFPLVGSIPFMIGPPTSIVTGIAKGIEDLGRIYTFWLGHNPYLIISDADAAQTVLSSPKYIEKGKNYDQFHWLMGDGLITSNGKNWKDDRRLLSPSFKYQRFDGFLGYFNKHSKVLVDILDKVFKDGESGAGVNLHPYLCRATMDFINESALGLDSNYQNDIHADFLEAVHLGLESFRTRLMRPWLNLPIIWDIFGCGKQEKFVLSITSGIMEESIQSRRNILAKGEDGMTSGTRPFIDALLDSKSSAEISGHIVTIFGAGFETTASGMNYTLFLLALHPHIQAKVHAELDSVLDDTNTTTTSSSEDVTFAHLAELKYLEMCIKEGLRLFPPAPAIIRHAVEDIRLDSGAVIPKGVEMLFLIREVHRDPEHFPSPEDFIPERFLPENCATRHPYSYIPFSAGPRNCLGLKYAMVQMKCCLAHILRQFTVSTTQKLEDIQMIYGMVLEPLPAIQLTLSPRRKKA